MSSLDIASPHHLAQGTARKTIRPANSSSIRVAILYSESAMPRMAPDNSIGTPKSRGADRGAFTAAQREGCLQRTNCASTISARANATMVETAPAATKY